MANQLLWGFAMVQCNVCFACKFYSNCRLAKHTFECTSYSTHHTSGGRVYECLKCEMDMFQVDRSSTCCALHWRSFDCITVEWEAKVYFAWTELVCCIKILSLVNTIGRTFNSTYQYIDVTHLIKTTEGSPWERGVYAYVQASMFLQPCVSYWSKRMIHTSGTFSYEMLYCEMHMFRVDSSRSLCWTFSLWHIGIFLCEPFCWCQPLCLGLLMRGVIECEKRSS